MSAGKTTWPWISLILMVAATIALVASGAHRAGDRWAEPSAVPIRGEPGPA